jgi:hypothetical protein
MKIHDLKSWPLPFMHVRSGAKRFEVRKNDRDYQQGDLVVLREFVPTKNVEALFRAATGIYRNVVLDFTGAVEGPFRIGYVEKGALVPDGYCVFELIPMCDVTEVEA